jgi:hypothetical protein
LKRYPQRLIVFFCLLAALFSPSVSPALTGGNATQVSILPLTINSQKDLLPLNQIIMDMKTLRISQWDGKIAAPFPIFKDIWIQCQIIA